MKRRTPVIFDSMTHRGPGKTVPGRMASGMDIMQAAYDGVNSFLDEVEKLVPKKLHTPLCIMRFPTTDKALIQLMQGIYWTPYDGVLVVKEMVSKEIQAFIKKKYPTIRFINMPAANKLLDDALMNRVLLTERKQWKKSPSAPKP